ncbi:hypothetical protein BJQ97_02036 [Geobacillus sp. TFV-3]|nr:hypothetical protein BJQ97_02036 [Geobacillus sp. TFV-3]
MPNRRKRCRTGDDGGRPLGYGVKSAGISGFPLAHCFCQDSVFLRALCTTQKEG